MKNTTVSLILAMSLTACNVVRQDNTTAANQMEVAPETTVAENATLMSDADIAESSNNMMEQKAADEAADEEEQLKARRFVRTSLGDDMELIVDKETGCELLVVSSSEYMTSSSSKVPVVVPVTDQNNHRVCSNGQQP